MEVYFNGVMLKNFPYVIKVYDTNKIKVIHPDRGTLDESVKLQSELPTVLNVEILWKASKIIYESLLEGEKVSLFR